MYKVLLVAVIVAVGAYFFWAQKLNPETIDNPVYAEFRVDAEAGSRTLNMVLIAETASDEDCEQRADKFWRHVLDGCPSCTFRSKACKHELEPRYSRLFEKEPTYTTYVAMTRGNRYERSGRLVVWGLTDRESQWLCGTMAGAIRGKYSGQIECINRRAS